MTMTEYQVTGLFPVPIYRSTLYPELTEEEVQLVHGPELYKFFDGQNYAGKSMTILNHPSLARIKHLITLHLNIYAKDVMKVDHELFPTISWLNRNPPGTSHIRHRHHNSVVSGVVYFTDGSPIEFYTDRTVIRSDIKLRCTEYNNYNSSDWWLPVAKGMIILFPSYMEHSVLANNMDHDRISLAFNSFVKGAIGDVHESDYLDLDDLQLQSPSYIPD